MKIRNGFISNSSSSNFVLGIKGDLAVERVMKNIFKVNSNSLFFNFAMECTEIFFSFQRSKSWEEFKQYMRQEHYCRDDSLENDECYELQRQLFKDGFDVIYGNIPDRGCDGDQIESLLCKMEIDYKSDSLVLKKKGF